MSLYKSRPGAAILGALALGVFTSQANARPEEAPTPTQALAGGSTIFLVLVEPKLPHDPIELMQTVVRQPAKSRLAQATAI